MTNNALQSPVSVADTRSAVDEPLPLPTFAWTPLAQALGIFAGIGASLGLFARTVLIPRPTLSTFLDKNRLAQPVRTDLLVGIGAGAGVALLLCGLYLAVRRERAVAPLRQLATIASPLSLSFLLPALFSWKPWHDDPLTYLVLLGAFVLLLEWMLRHSLGAIPESVFVTAGEKLGSPVLQRWLPLGVVLTGAIFYSVYISYYTLLNHRRFYTSGFDLGIHVNWAYNALHGHPWRCPVLFGPDGGHFIGNHAIFAMFTWLPLFALKPGSEILLIFQATIAGFAAVTLYLFGTTQLPRWSAALVAVAYLFYAPLHGPNFYDFHELLPPIIWHFLLYWAIAKRKYWALLFIVPMLYAHREDVAVGVAILGAFLLLTGARPRLGMVLAAISGVWFVLIKFVIMPRLWHSWFASIYKDLQPEGSAGYGSVVQTILVNPAYFLTTLLKEVKVIYFLHMFAPLAFLPARRPALLLLAIPGFFFSMMTTGYAPTISIAFQYTTHWVPYLFAGTVLMLAIMGRGEGGTLRRRAAMGAMVVGMASHSYVFGAILQHNSFVGGFNKVEFTMSPEETKRYEDFKRIAAMIPADGSVAATENEVPHVAARIDCYTLKESHGNADWILINGTRIGLGSTRKNLRDAFSGGAFGLVAKGSDIYLFHRGHVSADTDAALAGLGLK